MVYPQNYSKRGIKDYTDDYEKWNLAITWFSDCDREWSIGNVFCYEFTVDGVKFVIRNFTHDDDEDRYIVGLDMGYVEVDGKNTIKLTGKETKKIKILKKSEEWKKVYKNPSVFFSTDDCRCCSK